MLSVIIPHYNSPGLLRGCLTSWESERRALGHELEIIVSDDGSQFPPIVPEGVILVGSQENHGLAATCNQGAASAHGDTFLFLNSDVTVQEGFGRTILDADCDMAGVRIQRPSGKREPSARRFPSWLTYFFHHRAFLSRLFPNNRFSRSYTRLDEDVPENPDWVSGAALLIKRELFEELGGFDENFYMYFEDVDLCKRARDKGIEIQFLNDAVATHLGGATTHSYARKMIIARHKSMWRYYRKHMRVTWLTDIPALAAISLRGMWMWLRGRN